MQSKGRVFGGKDQAASASSSSSASLLFDSLIVTSKSPGCKASPIATLTPDTTPSTDAAQTVSIFIADSTTMGSPAETASPTATFTSTTTPGIGAPTAPICDESAFGRTTTL